ASSPSSNAYVTDRNVVEQRWAELLGQKGVDIRESTGVTKAEFRDFSERFDLVVDATGQPSMASKVDGTTGEYAGRMTALNAEVAGDFSALYPNSRILFENYLGYAWAFPKSESRANVGIGWAQDNLPDDYYQSFVAACERNGWPVPDRSATNVYTIPRGPSLDPERTWDAERRVARVATPPASPTASRERVSRRPSSPRTSSRNSPRRTASTTTPTNCTAG
ncbi:NAD(P)/FAD-dependent oxidoreductase, partial [Halogeometricum sp. CBA1124]|uniref:NAD(P)/FAD-dependent oxidoreductase n=1 Tax=Halogeometricum sp. CBA1124 TaxID=2668071 RepID=UPI003742AA7C